MLRLVQTLQHEQLIAQGDSGARASTRGDMLIQDAQTTRLL